MGPPKKINQHAISCADLNRQRNYFEYHYDEKTSSYFLLNPVTGEKLLQTNYDYIDRSQSLWVEPVKPHYFASKDAIQASNVHSIMLNASSYESRKRCIYRRFRRFSSQVEAVNHIITIARGFLARQRVRRMIRQRYCKVFDPTSKLYYFQDNHDFTAETSWYKPRLAYIDDILTNNILDADDYMQGSKYSYGNGITGPYYTLPKCGKARKSRAQHTAFIPTNTTRQVAVSRHQDIDIESVEIGSVISWLDQSALKDVKMTEYEYIRTVESTKDWDRIIEYMKMEPDNEYIQLYGFFSMSKHEVPIDSSGLLDLNGELAMDMCVAVISDADKINQTIKVFAMYALHNIISTTAGRIEYFNIINITEVGDGRHIAIETFITAKIMIFIKYLTKIHIEVNDPSQNRTTTSTVRRPTRRSADLVEQAFVCLADLANQNEYREQMAYLTAQPSIYALKVCAEESAIMISGLRYLYHLCYRCESGQEVLRMKDVNQVIILAHQHYAGDPEVMYQCRRLELALQHDGWRGNVDEYVSSGDMGSESYSSHHHDHLDGNNSQSLRSGDRMRFQYEEQSLYSTKQHSMTSSVSSNNQSSANHSPQRSIHSAAATSQHSRK